MTPTQKANIKAVKNALCRIDDELIMLIIGKVKDEKESKIKLRCDIENCLKVLEMLLTSKAKLKNTLKNY